VVGHTEWVHIEGAEHPDAHVVKALLEAGHRAAIASVSNFDRNIYRCWFGVDLSKVPVYYVLPKFVPASILYQRLLFSLSLSKAIEKERPDVVFVDTPLYALVLGLRKKYGFRIVEYIHVPADAVSLRDPDVEPYIEEVRSLFAKYEGGLWKHYYGLYQVLNKRVSRGNRFSLGVYLNHFMRSWLHLGSSTSPTVISLSLRVHGWLSSPMERGSHLGLPRPGSEQRSHRLGGLLTGNILTPINSSSNHQICFSPEFSYGRFAERSLNLLSGA